jgi:hypothetical protein
MDERKENLKELFDGFMGSDEAAQAASDIRRGDELLNDIAGPEPSLNLLAQIKTKVAIKLRNDKIKHAVRAIGSLAAAVVILAAVSVNLYVANIIDNSSSTAGYYSALLMPEIMDISEIDPELGILSVQLEQLANELSAIDMGEASEDLQADLAELEMELSYLDGDFWKG